MSSVNKVILIGNLGAEVELRYTKGGIAVCSLSLATTDKRKDESGEWLEQTEWHRINVWKNAAEACAKYLKKGSQIYVEGKLGTRKWENKDGVTMYSTEITAFTVQFLDSKGSTQDSGESKPQSKPAQSKPDPNLDDIPF